MASLSPEAFNRAIKRLGRDLVSQIGKKVHAEVTGAVYEGIVKRTPVLTGLARGSWNVTLGAPAEASEREVFGGSVTGEPLTGIEYATRRTFVQKLEALPLGSSIAYITSNLDYIIPLEEGTSPKAPPNAMVQGTIINVLDGLKVDVSKIRW